MTASPSTEDYLKTARDELNMLNCVLTCPNKKHYYQLILVSVKRLLWSLRLNFGVLLYSGLQL